MVSTNASSARPSPAPSIQEEYDLPDDYTPYVPLAKRRKQLLHKLEAKKNRTTGEVQREREEREREEEDEERQKEKARRERTLLQQAQEVKERKALEGERPFQPVYHIHTHCPDVGKTTADLAAEKEAEILAGLERGQKKLAGAQEISQGRVYTDSLKTSWVIPLIIFEMLMAVGGLLGSYGIWNRFSTWQSGRNTTSLPKGMTYLLLSIIFET